MDIEQDAIDSTPDITLDTRDMDWSMITSENTLTIGGGHPTHVESVKSIVMTPRMDEGPLQRLRTWWKSELKPGIHVVRKEGDGLRYMFLITSNSYEDRENETITTEALKAYEESCYPGEGLFHCDNPLLWWHDDDVVMGEIVAVNVSGPFLIEVAKELPTRTARVLWDYAETNGDGAGTSHRFGYLDKDRDENGVFRRIFKQETSYLPERDLAANGKTYAGVMMATPASDKRLDEIFQQVAGISDASKKLHAKTGELEKELAARGISHKALPPQARAAEGEAEAVEDVAEEVVEEDAKADMPMPQYMGVVNQILSLIMSIVDDQMSGVETQVAMAKALDDLKELRVNEKAQDKATIETLQSQIKALQDKVKALEEFRAMTPKRAADQTPTDPAAIVRAVDVAEKAKAAGETVTDSFWGELKPLPK